MKTKPHSVFIGLLKNLLLPFRSSPARLPRQMGRATALLMAAAAVATAMNLWADSWTETKKTVFVIRVDFSDLTGAFLTKAEIETIYNSGVSNQIFEMSYGKSWVEATASAATVRMPNPKGSYLPNNYDQLHNDAKTAFNALATGINLANYDVVCVLHKGIGMPYVGFTAGNRMWLQGSVTIEPNVVTHEMGHVYGLVHANAWQPSGASIVGPGSSVEYGDIFDRMGGVQTPGGHFNMQYKSQLNWLTSNQWTVVSASGTYRVYRIDDRFTTPSYSRGLRITKVAAPAEYYWAGYRRAISDNQYLANGAYLLWQQANSSQSQLLDTTPGSAGGWSDAALLIGRTYSDTTANVHLTPIANGGSGSDEWLDITVKLGPFPGNNPPAAGALTGPATLPARTPETYSVSATDPNGDLLAYAWDFGDGVPVINAASVTHSFAIGGNYTVRVTVSDMKGLTVTQSLAVAVSEPLTQWTARTSGTAADLQDVCAGTNGGGTAIVMAVGTENSFDGKVCTSANGSNWTVTAFAEANTNLKGVTYDGRRFIACGESYSFSPNGWVGGIWTSVDGTNWIRRYTGGLTTTMQAVASSGTTEVVVGQAGRILYSTNGGTNWTVAASTATGAFTGVAWGGGSFVAVGQGSAGPVQVFTSTNGIQWTDTTSGVGLPNLTYPLFTVKYCKDRFLSIGGDYKVRYSTDNGASFQTTRPGNDYTLAFAFGDGVFFAAGQEWNGTAWVNAGLVSTDGTNWTLLPTAQQDNPNAAAFFQNTFVTVGQNGAIWQSAPVASTAVAPTATTLAATAVSGNGATLNGSANPNGIATVGFLQWGTNTSYGANTTPANLGSGTSAVALSTPLSGLTPGVTYHFRAVASNSVAIVYGADLTFTTTAGSVAPMVSTLAATAVTTNAATLNGSANPNGSLAIGFFQWGTTTNYGQSTGSANLGNGSAAVALSGPLSGLTPGVTYHFRAVASNSVAIVYGADLSFTTSPSAPTVTTLAASGVTGTSATLNGTVNPNGGATTAYFQYGLTTNYGSFTATNSLPATNNALAVSNLIGGLSPGTPYHFRLVANNSAGSAIGADQILGILPHAFTGAGPGQGLDLQGTFLYAVNVGSNGAPGLIGDANFTADNVSGVTITTPGSTLYTFNGWANPNFGATTDGIRLAQAMSSIRYTTVPGIFTVNLDGLQVGRSYQLQLFFIENGYDRVFDVKVNGATVVPAFRLLDYGPSGTAIVIPYIFTATGTSALIQLGGGTGGNDNNPTLAAFTLEALAPAVTTLAASGVTITNATLNGTVNPNGGATTAYFQYGLTTNYGSFSATNSLAAANSILAVSNLIGSLASGTTYHYRLVGVNGSGTTLGSDLTFTTASSQPVNFVLKGSIQLGGAFKVSFTNLGGLNFTVLGATNLRLPLSNWTVLGTPVEGPPGQYQFTDSQATNNARRFYRVRSP